MAITTNGAHVSRALDFFNKDNIYFAIGKSTAWNEADTPIEPSITDEALQEIIGYKKVETMYMVVQDEVNGTISYRDSKWSVVAPDQAMDRSSKWVYLDTTLRYDELPLGYYRQVGLYTGLIPYQGRAQKSCITITSNATGDGNLDIMVGDTQLTVSVLTGDTTVDIATKILEGGVNGWTISAGDTTDAVIFTCNTVGVNTVSSSSNTTGVACTIETITEGTDAVSQKTNLLPSEVDNHGILEVVDNRGASNRLADQKEKLSLVIEF